MKYCNRSSKNSPYFKVATRANVRNYRTCELSLRYSLRVIYEIRRYFAVTVIKRELRNLLDQCQTTMLLTTPRTR